jgi:phage virion morphogenesis protein
MSANVVQIDDSRVRVALNKFRLSLEQKDDLAGNGGLMRQIGAAMLVSIRRTFREQGSPANSWMPLAPSTIKSDPKKYSLGHLLLIDHGTLLNSITYEPTSPGSVVIGTNLKYAAVHQFGSRDRGAAGLGPRTKAMQEATVNVAQHGFARLSASLGKGRLGGRSMNVRGPRNRIRGIVSAHTRRQNIPARPYLVFRPEDPERILHLVQSFVRRAASEAGLGGQQ